MKISYLASLLLAMCFTMPSFVHAQERSNTTASILRPLSIGDQVPDLPFRYLKNYPQKDPLPSDFKGKIIILDFWHSSCGACIGSFPKMEALQKTFKDQVQVILVTPSESEATINGRLGKLKQFSPQYGISPLPTVMGDSTWGKLFDYSNVPNLVWIDSNRRVIAITDAYQANPENVKRLLADQPANMFMKIDPLRNSLQQKGYLSPSDTALPVSFYSAFVRHSSAISGHGSGGHKNNQQGTLRHWENNRSPIEFFQLAFSTQHEKLLFLNELTHKDRFEKPKETHLWDEWYKQYSFCYEILMPSQSFSSWKMKLQSDANYFFGELFNIEAIKEKRTFTSWRLVEIKKGVLKTSSTATAYQFNDTLCDVKKASFQSFVDGLEYISEHSSSPQPIFDDTQLDRNLLVDIHLDIDLKNIPALQIQLRQYGLDLIRTTRDYSTLVIRDRISH